MNTAIKAGLAAWLACYSALLWAANTTFAEDMQAYDWVSLLLAAGAGLVGGAGRTLLTLLARNQLVGNQKVLLVKDLVVALFGGAAAFLCIEAWNAMADKLPLVFPFHIDRGLRVVLLVLAGASRGRWMGAIDTAISDLIARARKWVRGAPEDPPAVAVPPDSGATP